MFKCQMLMAAVWTEEFSVDVKSSVIALHAPVALGNKQFVLLCDLEQIDANTVCSAVRLCASKQCIPLYVCLQMNSVFCCVTEQISSVLSCMVEQCVLIMLHNCVCVKLTVCLCVQHPVQTLSHSTHQMSSRDLMSCALCAGTRCQGTIMACSPARVVKVRMRLHKQYVSSAVSKCSVLISDDNFFFF